MNGQSVRHFTAVVCAALILGACGGGKTDRNLVSEAHQNPFTDEFKNNLADATGGELDSFAQQGLQNALTGMDRVNPEFESLLPSDLQNEISDALEETDPAAMAENMALISALMRHCTSAAVGLAPRPGEPLLGKWSGQCEKQNEAKPKEVKGLLGQLGSGLSALTGVAQVEQVLNLAETFITGIFGLRKEPTTPKTQIVNMTFTVTPRHEGALHNHLGPSVLQTRNAGFSAPLPFGDVILNAKGENLDARVTVNPGGEGTVIDDNDGASRLIVVGNLTDRPHAGTGKIVQTELKADKSKASVTTCKEVKLNESHNPIPFKVMEAYKQMGSCLRPAIMLFSPAVARFLSDLPEHTAHMIKKGMLGIQ